MAIIVGKTRNIYLKQYQLLKIKQLKQIRQKIKSKTKMYREDMPIFNLFSLLILIGIWKKNLLIHNIRKKKQFSRKLKPNKI